MIGTQEARARRKADEEGISELLLEMEDGPRTFGGNGPRAENGASEESAPASNALSIRREEDAPIRGYPRTLEATIFKEREG